MGWVNTSGFTWNLLKPTQTLTSLFLSTSPSSPLLLLLLFLHLKYKPAWTTLTSAWSKCATPAVSILASWWKVTLACIQTPFMLLHSQWKKKKTWIVVAATNKLKGKKNGKGSECDIERMAKMQKWVNTLIAYKMLLIRVYQCYDVLGFTLIVMYPMQYCLSGF